MNPERWQKLDSLFQLALEQAPDQRSAFVKEVCAADDSLRQELEALLAAHGAAGQFMESPALQVEAESLANSSNGSILDQTIAHYKILSQIGEGGMGAVYLAHDTRLGRKVALKLLPAAYTTDKERVRRFQQEARAASALNHPNIVTIFEIGEVDEKHFIATEFIDGETLGQRIRKLQDRTGSNIAGDSLARLNIDQVVSIALQVADALSAAHSKQIIHRDIKPDNIILLKESHLLQQDVVVKLLDFGIAKLSEQATTSETDLTTKLLNTREGMVIGTASYMSPEQARGERVDARTDVWSLGIVLYEMLTNCVPFGGNTAQDVIASILKEEPPQLPPTVPDKLKWIVEKALRKNRDARYQTTREMFFDLRALQTRTESEKNVAVSDLGVVEGFKDRRRILRIALPILVAVGLLLIAVYKLGSNAFRGITSRQANSSVSFQNMKLVRLTNTGKSTEAAISPDGKYLVHLVTDGEQQSLWMKQVSSPGSDVRLNAPSDLQYMGLTFSPNGDDLYVNAWDKKSPFSLYRMSVLGGAATKLVVDIDSLVTFSPDQKQFAYMRGNPRVGEVGLWTANIDGTSERKIAAHKIPARAAMVGPAWAPDGNTIVWPLETSEGSSSYSTLVEVPVSGGTERRITSQQWWRIERIGWLNDGRGLIVIAREQSASPAQIWYLSYPSGESHRITNDLNDYYSLSLTADSSAFVTVESETTSNLWVVPKTNVAQANQVTSGRFDGIEGLTWTPDGRIIFAARAGDKLDLWTVDPVSKDKRQLTTIAGNNKRPSVSPDGRYVAFLSDSTGTEHIWRVDLDGSNATQLTNGVGEKNAQWSPDGQWIVFQLAFGRSGIWRVPSGGGEARQLVDKPTRGIAISPDGKRIATSYFEADDIKTGIYPFDGGEPEKIIALNANYVRWTPDGRSLLYIDYRKNQSVIKSYPVDGGTPTEVVNLSPSLIFYFASSWDDKLMAVARGTIAQDVILISNLKAIK